RELADRPHRSPQGDPTACSEKEALPTGSTGGRCATAATLWAATALGDARLGLNAEMERAEASVLLARNGDANSAHLSRALRGPMGRTTAVLGAGSEPRS